MLVATTELIDDRLHAAVAIYVSNATGSKFADGAVTVMLVTRPSAA